MKVFSIDKKLVEMVQAPSDKNRLVSLTNEEWAGEEFHRLPHHKKAVEQGSHVTGVSIQLFPDCAIGTLLILQKANQKAAPCPLSFYFNHDTFYFIGSQPIIEKLIRRANKNTLPSDTSAKDILGVFINLLIDEDNLFFMGLETSLNEMEASVLEKSGDDVLVRLNFFRKELRTYKTLYGQLTNISLTIQQDPYKMLTPEQCEDYKHLGVRSTLISEHIKDLVDYSLQIKDIYQSQIDMKQTRAMNILTIVSSIFLPLTLITGWYGMNFVNMSELQWTFSYPIVAVLAIVIVAVEIWIFWKKGLFK